MRDGFPSDIVSRLEERLSRFAREARLPGLIAGLVHDQSLVWSRGFGFADLESGRVPDADSLVRVASITKTLTAAAILQLRDAGHLHLDDPLSRFLPEFENARGTADSVSGVTLRRMLCHTAGLTTEPPLPCWDSLEFPTREALLAAVPQLEVVIRQDSAWKYSNLAFGLLGEVVSRAAGAPYFEYVASRILQPLGMSSSVFELTAALRPRLATGYQRHLYDDQLSPAPYVLLGGLAACGQLHSSINDLARWISLQFRTDAESASGAQILAGRTLEESHRPQFLEPDWSVGYCLGWRAVRRENRIYHGHGGGIHGFASQILFHKPTKLGLLMFANLWPYPDLYDRAVDELDGIVRAYEERDSEDEPLLQVGEPPEHIRKLLGPYVTPSGIAAQVEYRRGKLLLAAPVSGGYRLHAPAELNPTGAPDTFVVQGGRGAGEEARFVQNARGDWEFALGGFVYRRVGP